ncbi:MAG: hypothetical protein COX79_03295 [Candidatus Levybacteria bacterium CG_4_10_14_0_2_um_filter_36_16]|nr:MAG: hypothetical protein AUK12_00585 [Candidatus Levybacteria bacterium CG2_30_37_29]PIR79219.1 MAG: hypothetical protein COU26_02315 [Candidatus Levybacteria bacterium CG10_big_fil_rev_8_21_14_0_10_36_30]PIZ97142.1 MAG: hypothetical protein COX79_03295 [Candidatus Levybacteria bacterium CG_4_10_14_0_2_um_filter_36_16]
MRKTTIASFISRYKIYGICVIAVFILAFFLRAQESISGNYLFLIDQGRDMMAVKNIVFDHHLTLIGPYTSLQGIFQGPIWYYLLSIPVFLMSGNPVGTVYLMVIISMTVIFVSFFWVKKRFGIAAALFVAFLFAVSPEAIAASTYSWNPHPMWLLILLFIISIFEVRQNKSFNILLWISVSLMFHFEMALGAFFLLASVIYLLAFNRAVFKTKFFFIGVLIGSLFFIPQISFDLRHNFLMARSVMALFSGSNQGLLVVGESNKYLNLVVGHYYAFYGNFKSSFISQGFFSYVPSILLSMLIIVMAFSKKKKLIFKEEKQFLSITFKFVIIIFMLSFLYPFPIRYWFLTGFQTFYLLFFGIILSIFLRIKGGKLLVTVLILFFSVYSFSRLNILYFNPPNDGGTAKIKGKLSAVDYVYKDSRGKKFDLLVFTPPVYTDAYDYLIFWRVKTKYGYIPGHDKNGQFYLLMEPDYEKPWSYKGWLETVIKDGKVLSTVTLPSGIIIQKRIYEEQAKK